MDFGIEEIFLHTSEGLEAQFGGHRVIIRDWLPVELIGDKRYRISIDDDGCINLGDEGLIISDDHYYRSGSISINTWGNFPKICMQDGNRSLAMDFNKDKIIINTFKHWEALPVLTLVENTSTKFYEIRDIIQDRSGRMTNNLICVIRRSFHTMKSAYKTA